MVGDLQQKYRGFPLKQIVVFDPDGFFVEDRILFPVGENESGPMYEPLKPNETDVLVPSGFFRPRWDGVAWVEGLTPQEIVQVQAPPAPDWVKLVERLGDSPATAVLSQTSNAIALIALVCEVKADSTDYSVLKSHWDAVIDAIQPEIPDSFRESLNSLAIECYIPVALDSNFYLVIPPT